MFQPNAYPHFKSFKDSSCLPDILQQSREYWQQSTSMASNSSCRVNWRNPRPRNLPSSLHLQVKSESWRNWWRNSLRRWDFRLELDFSAMMSYDELWWAMVLSMDPKNGEPRNYETIWNKFRDHQKKCHGGVFSSTEGEGTISTLGCNMMQLSNFQGHREEIWKVVVWWYYSSLIMFDSYFGISGAILIRFLFSKAFLVLGCGKQVTSSSTKWNPLDLTAPEGDSWQWLQKFRIVTLWKAKNMYQSVWKIATKKL